MGTLSNFSGSAFGDAGIKDHRLSGCKLQKCVLFQSEGQKSEIKVSLGPLPLEALERILPHLLQLLVSVSIPGAPLLPSLSSPLLSLRRTLASGLRGQPHNPGCSHFQILSLITSAEMLFQG